MLWTTCLLASCVAAPAGDHNAYLQRETVSTAPSKRLFGELRSARAPASRCPGSRQPDFARFMPQSNLKFVGFVGKDQPLRAFTTQISNNHFDWHTHLEHAYLQQHIQAVAFSESQVLQPGFASLRLGDAVR